LAAWYLRQGHNFAAAPRSAAVTLYFVAGQDLGESDGKRGRYTPADDDRLGILIRRFVSNKIGDRNCWCWFIANGSKTLGVSTYSVQPHSYLIQRLFINLKHPTIDPIVFFQLSYNSDRIDFMWLQRAFLPLCLRSDQRTTACPHPYLNLMPCIPTQKPSLFSISTSFFFSCPTLAN
jgi:hypothetical protein